MATLTPTLQIQIKLEDIISIEKHFTAYVIPNAVQIITRDGKKVLPPFHSLT